MKYLKYKGETISQVTKGEYKGKYLVYLGCFYGLFDSLESAKKVVDYKRRKD